MVMKLWNAHVSGMSVLLSYFFQNDDTVYILE